MVTVTNNTTSVDLGNTNTESSANTTAQVWAPPTQSSQLGAPLWEAVLIGFWHFITGHLSFLFMGANCAFGFYTQRRRPA